jgi:hypothetical protein
MTAEFTRALNANQRAGSAADPSQAEYLAWAVAQHPMLNAVRVLEQYALVINLL